MDPTDRERLFYATARRRGLKPAGRNFLDKTLLDISRFFSHHLFCEEAARRNGLLQKVDPRARLLALLFFLVSVSLAKTIPALFLHAVLPLAAIAVSRIRPGEFLGAGFWVAILFSALMAFPATLNLFYDGTVVHPLITLKGDWRFGPVTVPKVIGITREGLLSAATFLLRVLCSTAAVLWLTLSTRWVDLLRALRSLRLPPIFLQVAGMTVRYVHVLLRQAQDSHLGKKSRSVCRASVREEQAWTGSRIAHSWERSLHLMEEVGAAMKARGFTGEAKFPPSARFGPTGWGLIATVMLSCIGAHLA